MAPAEAESKRSHHGHIALAHRRVHRRHAARVGGTAATACQLRGAVATGRLLWGGRYEGGGGSHGAVSHPAP